MRKVNNISARLLVRTEVGVNQHNNKKKNVQPKEGDLFNCRWKLKENDHRSRFKKINKEEGNGRINNLSLICMMFIL